MPFAVHPGLAYEISIYLDERRPLHCLLFGFRRAPSVSDTKTLLDCLSKSQRYYRYEFGEGIVEITATCPVHVGKWLSFSLAVDISRSALVDQFN